MSLEPTPNSDYINVHGEEHLRLANIIINNIKGVRKLLFVLVFIIFVAMAVITTNTVVTHRAQREIRSLSESNKKFGESTNRFLANYSDYMRCLVVIDEPLYKELGKEKYFNTCDDVLFRGTSIVRHPYNSVPTTNTTDGTTDTSNIIGG